MFRRSRLCIVTVTDTVIPYLTVKGVRLVLYFSYIPEVVHTQPIRQTIHTLSTQLVANLIVHRQVRKSSHCIATD